jgi:hypothetical protein
MVVCSGRCRFLADFVFVSHDSRTLRPHDLSHRKPAAPYRFVKELLISAVTNRYDRPRLTVVVSAFYRLVVQPPRSGLEEYCDEIDLL